MGRRMLYRSVVHDPRHPGGGRTKQGVHGDQAARRKEDDPVATLYLFCLAFVTYFRRFRQCPPQLFWRRNKKNKAILLSGLDGQKGKSVLFFVPPKTFVGTD